MFLSFLSNLFGFGKAVSEEVIQRDTQLNSDAMKANSAAKTRQEIAAQATKDVAGGDASLDQLRNDASEN